MLSDLVHDSLLTHLSEWHKVPWQGGSWLAEGLRGGTPWRQTAHVGGVHSRSGKSRHTGSLIKGRSSGIGRRAQGATRTAVGAHPTRRGVTPLHAGRLIRRG